MRFRLSDRSLHALEKLKDASDMSYGRVLELVFDGVRVGTLARVSPAIRHRGVKTSAIPVVFPHFKTVTIREDLSKRLGEEAKSKAYSSRSFYVGALFQIILQRVGLAALIAFVLSRPDLQEAVLYGR